jgi:multiple sugar transport system substrate-binding protein
VYEQPLRRRALAGLSAGAAATLAACGVGGAPAGGGTSSQAGGSAPRPVKFPESLAITTIYNFQQNDPGFMAAAEEFSKQNNVKLEFTPGNTQEVITKIAGGTPPDVFRRDAAAFHQLVAEGGLRDLLPYLASARDLKVGDIYPQLVKMQTFQGKLMALPEDFQPASILFYNRSLFDKGGEAHPREDWTWNQLLEAARKLTRGGGDVMDQYGYMFASFTWEQFVYNHGGQTVDNTENPGKLLLDTPQAIAGLEFMVDLQHRWKVMPSPQARTAAGLANEPAWFTANRLATVNHGTWQTATFLQAGDNLSWGMTLAPKGQDGKPHYGTGGAGWSIPREAKNPDASFEFIRWQFGPLGWKTWLSRRDPKVFWLPALRAMAEQEAKRLEAIYPNASLVVRSAESVFLRPGGVRWERAAGEVINPVLADLHQNKLPVRAAVTDMVSRANPILAGQ